MPRKSKFFPKPTKAVKPVVVRSWFLEGDKSCVFLTIRCTDGNIKMSLSFYFLEISKITLTICLNITTSTLILWLLGIESSKQ